MWQLFTYQKGRNKGKFDVVFYTNNNVIVRSPNQGYENKGDAIKAMLLVTPWVKYQDNTLDIPKVMVATRDGEKYESTSTRLVKPYQP